MVFEPAAIKVAVGDTVKFVPTDKGHDAAAVKELLPEGVAPFEGKMNQELVVKIEKEGRLRGQVHAACRHGYDRAGRCW